MDENKELIEEAQEKKEQKKTTIWNKIDQMLLKIKGQEAEPVKIKIEK